VVAALAFKMGEVEIEKALHPLRERVIFFDHDTLFPQSSSNE
jgi:hypothetical protein